MITRITTYFFQFADHRALRFMPRIVFGLLLVLWVTTLPYCNLLWGPTNVVFRFGIADGLLENAVLRLYYQPELFLWIYCSHPVLLILSMRNTRLVFIWRILAWITGLMLYAAAPNAFGWGVILILQSAFFLSPVHYESTSTFRLWLNSLALFFLRIQTIVILSTAALFAWGSSQWPDGDTVYYMIHQSFQFRFALQETFAESKAILTGITYLLLGIMSVLPVSLILRYTRFPSTLTLLITGAICIVFLTNMSIGFALATLALPWIDARESYD